MVHRSATPYSWRVAFAALVVLAASSRLVVAQGADVKVSLVAQRVVIADGKETLVEADKAKPGDTIQYAATYRNVGQGTAVNVGATVPIPAGLEFVADSAKPAAEQASVDGKNFSPIPLMHEVKNAAGAMESQPVPLSQYRALRWTIKELPAGSNATVSVRARVAITTASSQSAPSPK
jgi:uncharacterized repeat protein (TIGR01451 family)